MPGLERDLIEIINGLRLTADVRDSEADAATFAGDILLAHKLRTTAYAMRIQAAEDVCQLAKVAHERWDSPSYREQTGELYRQLRGDDADRAERMKAAEERIAQRRAHAVSR